MKNSGLYAGTVIFVAMLGFFIGGVVGDYTAHISMKRQAVKSGCAEWRIDENGNRSFHWKPATQPPPK